MDKERLKRSAKGIAKDVLIAFAIVCVVMLGLYAYCGIWPPMVVVESGSMQHSNDTSYIGVIDTGDMVFVKRVGGTDDVVAYVDGEATGYSTYGAFGDVVVYMPDGNESRVPIIHRLVMWVEVNETWVNHTSETTDYANYTFDVPSLQVFNSTETVVLENYGFRSEAVSINLQGLLVYHEDRGTVPRSGYITMGDNNAPFYDQYPVGPYELVRPEWIVGKAWGEIPWFGLIKLGVTGGPLRNVPSNSWIGLYVSIFLLLFVPFMIDMFGPKVKRWWRERREAEPAAPAPMPEPPQATGAPPEPEPATTECEPEPPRATEPPPKPEMETEPPEG